MYSRPCVQCNSKVLFTFWMSDCDPKQDHMEMPKNKTTWPDCIYLVHGSFRMTKHSNIHMTNQNIILNLCGNNVNVLKCVCTSIYRTCVRAYNTAPGTSSQSSLPWLQSSFCKPLLVRCWSALSSQDVCVSFGHTAVGCLMFSSVSVSQGVWNYIMM